MAIEDFTTYTEVDPNSKITVDSDTVSVSGIDSRTTVAYVYKDKGAAHFNGDFEHLFLTNCTSLEYNTTASANLFSWAISTGLGSWGENKLANEETLAFLFSWVFATGITQFVLYETLNGTTYSDSSVKTNTSTTYYMKIKRDESIGDNGALYAYIYSDANRTTLVDTLSLALHTKEDYRYIYPYTTRGDVSNTRLTSGYVENLDLQEKKIKGGANSVILGHIYR